MIDDRTQEQRDAHAAALRNVLRAVEGVKWSGDTVQVTGGLITIDLSGVNPEHALSAVMHGAYAQGFETGQRIMKEYIRSVLGIKECPYGTGSSSC